MLAMSTVEPLMPAVSAISRPRSRQTWVAARACRRRSGSLSGGLRCSVCRAKKLEAEAIAGGAIDLDAYGALADRLSRLFARLGLKRVARDRTPTIDQIMAGHRP